MELKNHTIPTFYNDDTRQIFVVTKNDNAYFKIILIMHNCGILPYCVCQRGEMLCEIQFAWHLAVSHVPPDAGVQHILRVKHPYDNLSKVYIHFFSEYVGLKFAPKFIPSNAAIILENWYWHTHELLFEHPNVDSGPVIHYKMKILLLNYTTNMIWAQIFYMARS